MAPQNKRPEAINFMDANAVARVESVDNVREIAPSTREGSELNAL
ncbi:hypothetical protein [Silanimonas sp.]|nr:hypothetical protein [Silanimonas sp.]